MVERAAFILVPLTMLAAACSRPAPEPALEDPAKRLNEQAATETRQHDQEREACAALRQNLALAPALEGVPALEKSRHLILGRARGWPVVFTRAPRHDLTHLTPYFARLAEALADPKRAYSTVKTLRSMLRHSRAEARAVLLREGYLYADNPELASWLVTEFTLDRLFDEPELWLLRGSEVIRLERTKFGYRYDGGEQNGQPALLLLFDRVATNKDALFPALHVDFTRASAELGFDRVRVERMTSNGIVAHVRYGAGGPWIGAAFAIANGRATQSCELLEEADRQHVHAFREEQRIRQRALAKLHEAVWAQVDEMLPFDEPREEVGQQDGSLRPAWEWSYRTGRVGYSFNQVWYPVFDRMGRPRPPQVCVDFILDSFERASGTWYRTEDQQREKVVGQLVFEGMANRRSVEAVVEHFRANPGTFRVNDLAPQERIRYSGREAFLTFVRDEADRFRPMNVVTIHGPRGDEAHYHSVIVFRVDPVTGMPVELAENAGKARVRSWQSVMQSGPLRSIRTILEPHPSWLATMLAGPEPALASAGDPGGAGLEASPPP